MSDVKFALVDDHLMSVVFSVSNLALYPAMQAVYGILLEQDFVSSWSSRVAIVSRIVADLRAHRGHHNLRVRCTASRHWSSAEDRRALLCLFCSHHYLSYLRVCSFSAFLLRVWRLG